MPAYCGLTTYLALLRVEIASFHPASPFNLQAMVWLRRGKPIIACDLGPAKLYHRLVVEERSRLVSVALIRPPCIMAEMGVTHYAVLWSPDFPPCPFGKFAKRAWRPLE